MVGGVSDVDKRPSAEVRLNCVFAADHVYDLFQCSQQSYVTANLIGMIWSISPISWNSLCRGGSRSEVLSYARGSDSQQALPRVISSLDAWRGCVERGRILFEWWQGRQSRANCSKSGNWKVRGSVRRQNTLGSNVTNFSKSHDVNSTRLVNLYRKTNAAAIFERITLHGGYALRAASSNYMWLTMCQVSSWLWSNEVSKVQGPQGTRHCGTFN